MINLNQIRSEIASYLVGDLPFAEFEDWLLDNSWDMHKDSSEDVQNIVHEINASIYEYLDQYINENQLRVKLRHYVQHFDGPRAHLLRRQLLWCALTDVVKVALITNVTVVVVAFLSRLWSRIEHRSTERTAKRTERKVDALSNGYQGDK